MVPDYKDKDIKEQTTIQIEGVNGGATRTILEQVGEYLNDKGRYRRAHSCEESDKDVEEGIKWSGVTAHEEQHPAEEWHTGSGLHMDVDHIDSGMMHVEDIARDNPNRSGAVDTGAGHFLDFSLLDGEHDREKALRELKDDYHGGNAKDEEHHAPHHQEQHSYEYQEQQQHANQKVDSQSVFSPMVSPMVQPHGSVSGTPYLTADMVHNAQNTPYLQNHVPAPGAVLKERALFSPLSSPSIAAGEGRRSNSFSLPEASIVLRKGSSAPRTKKTPHSTPYMGASVGKVTKSSPLVGPKKTSSSSPKYKSHGWDDMFKLPNSSLGGTSSAPYSNSTGSSSSDAPKAQSTFATDDVASDYNRSRPATLMNFPKFILPSNTNSRSNTSSNGMVIRATESPVIKPRQVSSTASMNELYGDGHSSTPSGAGDPHLRKRNSKAYDSNGPEGDLIKKEVHKVAEQGRRNRLNNALMELNSLLPAELKDSVQIPSKATTVELACKYIRELTGQGK